jgi:hypothetical protein
MTRRYVLLAAASIAMLAACSSSDGQTRVSGPDPITAPSITSTPATTQPAPAAAPATQATTEAVANTSTEPAPAITTLDPMPTTTLDPIAELEAAVSRDFAAGEQALLEAYAEPNEVQALALLEQHHVGVVFDRVLNALFELQDQGLRVKPNPDVPQVAILVSGVKFIGTENDRVLATTCRVDAAIVFIPGQQGDVDDIVVNDTIRRTVAENEFVLINGIWKLSSGNEVSNQVCETSCADV